jgi:phosphoribosyl-ATP pyrophosphohydrolase/phosphoribosyl-AMP cyclohydrolase
MTPEKIPPTSSGPEITFDAAGLIPAIVQDSSSGRVLMLGYMNRESLELTRSTGFVHFFSRSRRRLWKKGEESGHFLRMKGLLIDCDRDSLLVLAKPEGPTCHTGRESCFFEVLSGEAEPGSTALADLAKVISDRAQKRPKESYTVSLLEEGLDRILRKVGEESAELLVAAKNADKEEIRREVADLLYHVLVLLQERRVPLNDVMEVLRERRR